MNFSFDGGSSQSNVVAQLAGNAIYTVKFDGIESKDIENKTSGEKYKILSVKFKNDQGVFEDSIFEPKEGDNARKKNQFGYDSPAPAEELMFKLKHLLAAVAPKIAEQIEKKGGLAVGSWDELRAFMVKHTATGIGTETQIKLLTRTDAKGVTRAVFPSFVLGINKEGKAYPRTNFIGSALAFTAKEQEKIDNANSAAKTGPTNVDNLLTVDAPALKADDLDDLNFDNL
jgi:hypothetical protein